MKTLIIDSNNVGWIVRYALGEELSYDDEDTGVMWGFMSFVLNLAKQFKTHKFIFCWDSSPIVLRFHYWEMKNSILIAF